MSSSSITILVRMMCKIHKNIHIISGTTIPWYTKSKSPKGLWRRARSPKTPLCRHQLSQVREKSLSTLVSGRQTFILYQSTDDLPCYRCGIRTNRKRRKGKVRASPGLNGKLQLRARGRQY